MPTRKLFAAVAVLVIAVVLLAWELWPARSPLGQAAEARDVVCAACGHTDHRQLAQVPDRCAACGQQQVYPAVACPYCRAAVPLRTITGPQRPGGMLTCPKCKRSFAPRQPGHAPAEGSR